MAHMSPRLKARRGRFGAAGLAPTINITSPANNASFASNESGFASINFVGEATDPEDGDISSSIIWSVPGSPKATPGSPAGVLGTGASISGDLEIGEHVVTATAFATSGSPRAEVTASITVTVLS